MNKLRDPLKHEPDRPSVTAEDIDRVLANVLDLFEMLQFNGGLTYETKMAVLVNEDMVIDLRDKLEGL